MYNFNKWNLLNEENGNTEKLSNSELLAKLAILTSKRKKAISEKRDFESQVLEIETKLVKLEIEKNDLLLKKSDLESARKISEKNNKEGRTNVKI